jgi:hypothetical protein
LFDDENLVSCAGLAPVMALAEQAGLSELIAQRVTVDELVPARVASGGVNPAGKLTCVIAGMSAGADSIDDLEVIRSGGMRRLFGQVYAPATRRCQMVCVSGWVPSGRRLTGEHDE